MRVGYLGPPGSFCEEALLQLDPGDGTLDEVPYPTVIDCFDAVRAGEVPAALVPAARHTPAPSSRNGGCWHETAVPDRRFTSATAVSSGEQADEGRPAEADQGPGTADAVCEEQPAHQHRCRPLATQPTVQGSRHGCCRAQ